MNMGQLATIIECLQKSEPKKTNEFYRHYFIQWRSTVETTLLNLMDTYPNDINRDWFLSHFDLSLTNI